MWLSNWRSRGAEREQFASCKCTFLLQFAMERARKSAIVHGDMRGPMRDCLAGKKQSKDELVILS